MPNTHKHPAPGVEEAGAFPNDPTGLRRDFAIKFHRGDFLQNGEDNSELISDWWLENLHHQLQKAREEERERSQVEVLAAITGLQEALDNAPMTFNQDIDITEVPDGLAHELRGMKKGWHAALEQLKANLNV